jgi:arylsulfatase A-like enzyme
MIVGMKQPHILLITTDQQRGDCLGLDGHPVLSTPNLDEIGGEGTYFEHAYSEVPSCIAARRILLSGMHQTAAGLVGYRDQLEWNPPHTLPGELTKAGYQTHLVGKLHFWPHRKRYGFESMDWSDGPYTRFRPNQPEEEDDYISFLRRAGIDEADAGISHGISINGWAARPTHLNERLTFEYWCVSRAIEFLRRRDPSQPFFLNLSFYAPHPPFTPPALYFDRYMQMDLPTAPVGDWVGDWVDAGVVPTSGPGGAPLMGCHARLDPATLKRCRAGYYGLINHVDDQLGRLFQALRQMNLWKDTLILFTSDHGEMLGDHHWFRKGCAYEGSARVPFIVRPPGWMNCRHGRVAGPVGLQDVCPTLLEAAGCKIPSGVCGQSVMPFLRGETPAWREFLHGEHSTLGPSRDAMQYLTDGKEKYIWFTQTGEEQFFDLREDKHETRNLIRDTNYAIRIALWRSRLIAQLKDRPEGFSDGRRLIAGRKHSAVLPETNHEP